MSDDSQDRVFSGFVRQRRNLVVISLLVLFTHYAQIKITQINVLGNHVDVGNPDAVYYGLWTAFFYWLVRYYQFYRDLGGSGFLIGFYGRMGKYVCAYACRNYKSSDEYLQVLKSKEEKGRTIYPEVQDFSIIGRQPWECQLRIVFGTGPNAVGQLKNVTIESTGWPLWWMRLRAVTYVLLHTRVFTEYWLPFVLASIVILHGLPEAIIWLEHFTS